MVKHGGFFKRMKAAKKRAEKNSSRGTQGRSREDRNTRHNELVDFYQVKRQAEKLQKIVGDTAKVEDLSSNDGSDANSHASSSDEGESSRGANKLAQLRGLLGCGPTSATRSAGASTLGNEEDDFPSDADLGEENYDDDGDDDLFPGEEEDDEEVEDDVDEEEEDAANDGVDCANCGKMLDDEDEDGMVCITCQATYCRICFKRVHGQQAGHQVVSLKEVDSGAAAQNLIDHGDQGGEDADEDGEFEDDDDSFDFEGAGLGEEGGEEEAGEEEAAFAASESDEEDNVQAEQQLLLTLPKAKRSTTSVSDVLKNVGIQDNDAWYQKYHLGLYGDSSDNSALSTFYPSSNTAAGSGSVPVKDSAVKQLGRPPQDWLDSESPFAFQASAVGARRLVQHIKAGRTAHVEGGEKKRSQKEGVSSTMTLPLNMLPQVWKMWVEYRTQAFCSSSEQDDEKPSAEDILSTDERAILETLSSYGDILATNRTWDNEKAYMELSCLHLINHHFKTRLVVAANNQTKRMKQEAVRKSKGNSRAIKRKNRGSTSERYSDDDEPRGLDDEDETEYRDRGFGKTRLLLLLPMRNLALKYVDTMLNILGLNKSSQRKYDQFRADFSEVEEAMDKSFKRRPLNYRRQFEGNINDTFCFGMTLPKHFNQQQGGVSFYSHVLNSDIVIASPVGLRQRVERNADAMVGLSSIEVCLIDQANAIFMQNWSHCAEVIQLLNQTPKDTTEGLSDISRVYSWALDGKAKNHRQTVCVSEWNNAAFLSVLRKSETNTGKFVISDAKASGALSMVMQPIRQHFRRFEATNQTTMDDDRFTFFKDKVFPSSIQQNIDREVRTIIFVPSYFDFVKLRNWMYHNYRESFTSLSEYTTLKEQRKALGEFTDLEKPILIMTERFYFFKRYFVKMAETIIFYSPPVNSMFYYLLIGKLEAAKTATSSALVIYCKYDLHEIIRLVGSERAPRLIGDKTDAFFFVTNN